MDMPFRVGVFGDHRGVEVMIYIKRYVIFI
jgi:hypothetical protein